MTYRLSALILVAAIGTFGCAGGQSGGELGADDGTGGGGTVESGGCDETSSALAPNEASPLGFAAEDILAFAAGTFDATMTYLPDDQEFVLVDLTPDSVTTNLTVTVESKGAAAFVVSEPQVQTGGGLLIDMASSCQDYVAIDVSVQIRTDDGAFDETLDGQLVAYDASHATLSIPLDLAALTGSFAVEVVEPQGGETVQTTAEIVLGPGIFAGEISGMVQVIGPQVAQAGGTTYGRWGYGDCASGQVPVNGDDALTGTALLDVVNGSSPLSFVWSDGTATELSIVAVDPGELCVELPDAILGVTGGGYHLAADATLGTADGRLDTTQRIDVGALTEDGALTELTLSLAGVPSVEPGAFESTFGLSGVDLGDYTDIGMWLELAYGIDGTDATVSGELSVVGIPPTDCVSTPNSSCGSPGQQPIETATIRSP